MAASSDFSHRVVEVGRVRSLTTSAVSRPEGFGRRNLALLGFPGRREDLVLIGGVDTSKTHMTRRRAYWRASGGWKRGSSPQRRSSCGRGTPATSSASATRPRSSDRRTCS